MAVIMLANSRLRSRPNGDANLPVMDGRLSDRISQTFPTNWTAVQWPSLSNAAILAAPAVRDGGAVLRIKTNTGERVAVTVTGPGQAVPSGTAAAGHEIEALDTYDLGVFQGETVHIRAL